MLGWIVLALILWLAAAMRTLAGPRQAGRRGVLLPSRNQPWTRLRRPKVGPCVVRRCRTKREASPGRQASKGASAGIRAAAFFVSPEAGNRFVAHQTSHTKPLNLLD
jgi:hypothetical protein